MVIGRTAKSPLTQTIKLRLVAALAVLPALGVLAAAPFIEKQNLFRVGEYPACKRYHIPGIVGTARGTVLARCEARRLPNPIGKSSPPAPTTAFNHSDDSGKTRRAGTSRTSPRRAYGGAFQPRMAGLGERPVKSFRE
jgi:hypothetical protein